MPSIGLTPARLRIVRNFLQRQHPLQRQVTHQFMRYTHPKVAVGLQVRRFRKWRQLKRRLETFGEALNRTYPGI